MRATPLGSTALFLIASIGIAGLTSCSQHSTNSLNSSTPPESNGPHIYLQANVQNGSSSTYGYSVSSDGQLTAISGFPLSYAIGGVVSGNYLFTANADGIHIDTYQIQSDGTLTKVQSFDDTQASAKACSQCVPGFPQFADPSGTTLYVTAGVLDGGDWEATLQTFAVDPATGAISYVSTDMGVEGRGYAQVFGSYSANGAFLYGTNETTFTAGIVLATPSADGSLAESGPTLQGVSASQVDSVVIGTDTKNHLVATIQPTNTFQTPGVPIQLASFTINSDGSLTTTNTSAQMPATSSTLGSVSPDGTLIAMAGAKSGIQLYNFNGANPITALGGMVATDQITSLSWDKQNHLYALSPSHELYVFNVASSGATPAPGSPHSIANAWGLLVQP